MRYPVAIPNSSPNRAAKRRGLSLTLWLFALLLPLTLGAQNKSELEQKRKKLTREIESTSTLLKRTTKDKSAAYERFVTLQNQMDRRESLIETIESELIAADEGIVRNQSVITSLEADVAEMKAEYGRMLRTAYRRKTLNNPLLYILSAESLNQAFRRFLFLRKYNAFRKGQAQAITFTMEILTKKIAAIQSTKTEKAALLESLNGQRGTLSQEIVDKNDLLQSLSKDEVVLRQELQQKQQAKAALDGALDRIIAVEINKKADEDAKRKRDAAEKAKTTPKPAEKTTPKPTVKPTEEVTQPIVNKKPEKPAPQPTVTAPPKPEKTIETSRTNPEKIEETTVGTFSEADEDNLSQSFRRQQGKMSWPVAGGFIARNFGRQKHPTLKNIEVTNNGVDIRTTEDAPVHSIFEGKVAGVQFIPGHSNTVIIQHGDYYTVYSNLSETSLTKGDLVAKGQTLGRVTTNALSGAAELHFEVWHKKERMNPAVWIK